MAMFENFPYTDMHNLNLDWIIKIAKDFLDQYTHIQELISTGIEDIDNKTEEGLENLDEKTSNSLQELETRKEQLVTLLNAWYDTHSSDIANQLASALQELATFANTTFTTFSNQIDTKAANTLETIPADYTELYFDVESLQTNLTRNISFINCNTSSIDGSLTLPDSVTYRTSEILFAKKNSKIFFIASDTYNLSWIITYYSKNGTFATRSAYHITAGGADQIISIANDCYVRISFCLTDMGTMTEEIFNHAIELFKYVRFDDPKTKNSLTKLYDLTSTLSSGYFNATTGVKIETDRWKYTVYDCKQGDVFVFTGISTTPCSIALFYSGNDLIGNAGVSPEELTKYRNVIIKVPDYCTRVLFNTFVGDGYAEFSVYKFNTEDSKLFTNEADLLNLLGHNRYDGKKININGDSIATQLTGIWSSELKNFINGTYTNIASGGTKMTGEINSTARIAQLDTDADIVLTNGGANDWAANIPLGSISTIDDPTTFAGAVHLYIERVMTRCPNARIICMGTQYINFKNRFDVEPTIGEKNNLGLRINDYNDMFRQVCEFDSIEFINIYELVGINRFNYTTYLVQDTHDYGYGYIHPNTNGAKKYVDTILNYLYYNKNS